MEKRDIKDRINHKIEQIREYLDFLVERIPNNLEDYKNDLETKAICERYIQKIVDAVIDLVFFVINLKKLRQPVNEETIFNILADGSIIEYDLAIKLDKLKGMRNFITHQYDKIDDDIIFTALTEEIKEDIEKFISSVLKSIEEEKAK